MTDLFSFYEKKNARFIFLKFSWLWPILILLSADLLFFATILLKYFQ